MVEDWYIYCKQVQAAKPVRQKEVADMLSMISYAEENGEKRRKPLRDAYEYDREVYCG